ncbi:hypothetical protein B4U80_07955 [Leptotrombidium deliense]|uniref:BHLH domain-containing protein n=1 Tax=Leptotrombidium deliense TaxID=299467 RepID=A0A443SAC5_9ACAR|nr:hypothetical protein B4U80_07955 [Leptotrombidium deliense]
MDLRSHPHHYSPMGYEPGSSLYFSGDSSPETFSAVYPSYAYSGYTPHQNVWSSDATFLYGSSGELNGAYRNSSSPSSNANSPVYSETKVCDYFGSNSSYIPGEPVVEYTTHIIGGRVVKKRVTANKKERRRTMSINSAFSNLRNRIPNVPEDTKLSKIKTLRLATSYIAYLMNILDESKSGGSRKSQLLACEDFKVDLQRFKAGTKSGECLVS